MEEIKKKRGRPPMSIPKEYRGLSKNLEETTDQLMDAINFIEISGLKDEWEIFKAEQYEKRLKAKGR